MEILEYFDEYKAPWKILSRDISEDLARAYIDKLCYDHDSDILNGASKADVINAIAAAIGIGRMKTFIHTLTALMQMRHLAVDAALSRVECEKFYVENKDGTSKKTYRQHTVIDDRMEGVFAAIKADTTSTIDFAALNKFTQEERTYRIHCIALKLFCTLWLKCYASNPSDANTILPDTFVVFSSMNNGRKIQFTPQMLFGALTKTANKAATPQSIDETSIEYLLTTEAVDVGIYSKVPIIEAVWLSVSSSPIARKYLDALCNNINDIASPVTEETNGELLECYREYNALTSLHEAAQFRSIAECHRLCTSDTIRKDATRSTEYASFFNSLSDINTDSQQLIIKTDKVDGADIATATVVYGDTPFSFTLSELEDKLVDKVAIIPALVDKGDNTYAVCECEYEDFMKDPEKTDYWQPADDLLYFKYIKQQARQIQPQRYDVVSYLIDPDKTTGEAGKDNYVENMGASLIKPTLYCHKCGRLMLPTADFMTKLSLAATSSQISTGGQLNLSPMKNSDGFILNHTANAIGQKLADLNKTAPSSDVGRISWPEVVAVGSRHEIEPTNVFVQSAYADYFMQMANAVMKTQANLAAAKLEIAVAKIAEEGRKAHLGFSRLDYLYTLVTQCDSIKINMKSLAMQSRVYYGAETMLAYIRQARAAVNSKIYDTNIYDKIDMPFDYSNIRPLLECIYSPADCIAGLGFSSIDELMQAINISMTTYTMRNVDSIATALLPERIEIPADESISREEFDAMTDKAGIETRVQEAPPSKPAILVVLDQLEVFYSDLNAMAHAERMYFFKTIAVMQGSISSISALEDATDIDNMLSAAEVSILHRSMTETEFWSCIDEDKYTQIILAMADNLKCGEISAKSSVIGRSTVDSLINNDKLAMQLKLDADAIGKIVVDTATELPSLACLHQRFTGNSENTYEHMVATYLSACGLLEDTGAFLADEAADFAIKIYYECVVNDAISTLLKKNIANNVTTESYYSTGGLEQ